MFKECPVQRIEVITGEQKRRRYTPEEKARFVALAMQPGYIVSLVARQYGITPSLIFKWKRLMNEGGKSAIAAGDEVVSVSGLKALEKKVKQLEQMLGRKTMEAEILRDALEIAQGKKVDIAHAIAATGRYPLIRIAEVLCVSRSNLYDRLLDKRQHRSARYSKDDDARLLPLIRQICSERATNGYHRVTAHLNRALKEHNWRVNPKRIYRIMQANNLLLAKSGHKKPERCHTGSVVTLKPDTRWCSDGFEIRCWNREVVRVVFSLDCCDREAISWSATTGGINSVMVQDLLTESVEKRFGNTLYLPHAVEWLTDNGSCYIADATRTFAASLGFIVCTTPVRSPESNGMAESFVKTFKRDYVYVNDLPDAVTVMEKLTEWMEDYNNWHPHKGLKMQSPREYRSS
ncbi:TPA: IS3 family transposase, partial [Klebsiella pneumoniae]|nr:IS3 family transposase [Klebsiella pneumoniae]HCA9798277.1 IS3 family transposase [Klebsiella variicola subsp. variicola]EKW9770221.1 IS3 family transposase [Klebsiella pneumoniae]EKZ5977726.1 IS3 family transposase [Klebsiella pneumoniae]ELA3318219.1 IS3 family transposase [Klebsiella pneumoniae]